MPGWDGRGRVGMGGSGTIRRRIREGSRIGVPEIYMCPDSPRALAWTRIIRACVGLVPASRSGQEGWIDNCSTEKPIHV